MNSAITTEKKSTLELAQAFDLTALTQYVAKNYPQYGQEQLENLMSQYRLYMFLSASSKNPLAVPSLDVDNVWHSHLILNGDYNKFTKMLAGRIIIHSPHTEAVSEEMKMVCKQNLVDAAFAQLGYFPFNPSATSCNLQPCTDIKSSCNCVEISGNCSNCCANINNTKASASVVINCSTCNNGCVNCNSVG